jgi:hypothetical protein
MILRGSWFLDETGTATNMTGRYGRCLSDQRLVAAVPHGRRRTTTFVAGLRQSDIVAPLVLDGSMIGTVFRAYVEQLWCQRSSPATSWCSTTARRTRSTASARRSPRPVLRSSICRITAQI